MPDLTSDGDIRSVLSPVKPVNLLPQIPINSNSFRKLSENEEHDCEIIGMYFLILEYDWNTKIPRYSQFSNQALLCFNISKGKKHWNNQRFGHKRSLAVTDFCRLMQVVR